MGSKMRILQLIASSHGGGATHVLDLSAQLPIAGFSVTVGMPQDGGNVSCEAIEATGATFMPLDIRYGLRLEQVSEVRALLQSGAFDVMHVHGARAGLYGRLAAMTLPNRPKILFSIHGFATPFYPIPQKQVYLGLERLFQRVTDHTICVARAEQETFLSYGLTRPEKTSVIPPGIPLERFQPGNANSERPRQQLNLAADAPVIVTLCRLHPPRDFETLLSALAQVKQTIPNVQLLIVGDGPMRDKVAAQIVERRLTQNVHLLGFRQDIPDLLALANIYTLTTTGWEGCPISALEAQAMGCPPVISDAGGAKEAVLHGKTGLVIPKKDPGALAEAILALLLDSTLRQSYASAGIERAHTELSRTITVQKIIELYRNV